MFSTGSIVKWSAIGGVSGIGIMILSPVIISGVVIYYSGKTVYKTGRYINKKVSRNDSKKKF